MSCFAPKRSTLKSRSQVSLTRQFTFKHTQTRWRACPSSPTWIPSAASPWRVPGQLRDDDGGAQALQPCAVATFVNETDRPAGPQNGLTGTFEEDFTKTRQIRDVQRPALHLRGRGQRLPQHFVEFCAKSARFRPNHVILAGKRGDRRDGGGADPSGADIVKVGIGPLGLHHRVKTGSATRSSPPSSSVPMRPRPGRPDRRRRRLHLPGDVASVRRRRRLRDAGACWPLTKSAAVKSSRSMASPS